MTAESVPGKLQSDKQTSLPVEVDLDAVLSHYLYPDRRRGLWEQQEAREELAEKIVSALESKSHTNKVKAVEILIKMAEANAEH